MMRRCSSRLGTWQRGRALTFPATRPRRTIPSLKSDIRSAVGTQTNRSDDSRAGGSLSPGFKATLLLSEGPRSPGLFPPVTSHRFRTCQRSEQGRSQSVKRDVHREPIRARQTTSLRFWHATALALGCYPKEIRPSWPITTRQFMAKPVRLPSQRIWLVRLWWRHFSAKPMDRRLAYCTAAADLYIIVVLIRPLLLNCIVSTDHV